MTDFPSVSSFFAYSTFWALIKWRGETPSWFLNSRQDIMEQKIRSSFPSAVKGEEVPSTAFPTGCSLGATWDENLVRRVGNALGEEFRAYGINGILGPAMNIKRHPLCEGISSIFQKILT